MSFPHINYFVKQVTAHPEQVSGGTVSQRKEGDQYTSEVIEKFYPLFKP